MANLSYSELRKYDYRPEVFIKKVKDKSAFEVKGGKKVVLQPLARGVGKILVSGASTQVAALRFTDGKGGMYKITDFVKSKDFGGKGEGSGTAKEDAALSALRKQIMAAKKKEGKSEIIVLIGKVEYRCADVITTPGTPKSDFHLVDVDGNETAWISHKDGKTEKDFQQWGGLSQTVEPTIYAHKETQAFIDDLQGMFPNGMPAATTVARRIKNSKLKMMAVYGNEYGKPFSRQNTTLMLQGSVTLKKSGTAYKIEGYHTHVNGDSMRDGYEPVFMAIYKGDRSQFGIKGARVGISPIGGRKITSMV